MRVLLAFVAVAIGPLAMGPSALAAPKPPTQPAQDSVSYSGIAEGGMSWQFEVDARSGPSGENATGHLTVTRAGGTFVFFDGPVTCLAVAGNVAIMNVQTPQFGIVVLRFTDAGPGGQELIEATPLDRDPRDCSQFVSGVVDFLVRTGDIRIVDAPPAPTSKDQCTNGGYVRFGFKNQGQCVASIARDPGR